MFSKPHYQAEFEYIESGILFQKSLYGVGQTFLLRETVKVAHMLADELVDTPLAHCDASADTANTCWSNSLPLPGYLCKW